MHSAFLRSAFCALRSPPSPPSLSAQTGLTDVITFTKRVDNVEVNVALRWVSDGYSDTLLGYANSIRTSDGGSHLDGFKAREHAVCARRGARWAGEVAYQSRAHSGRTE